MKLNKQKKCVAYFTADNVGIAALAAQIPGGDELLLSGVEALMAGAIVNGIYGFSLSKTFMSSMVSAYLGNKVGMTAFKLTSKAVTWIPGIGNAVNATVAGATTYALGNFIIDQCEKIQKELERGKKIDEILRGL